MTAEDDILIFSEKISSLRVLSELLEKESYPVRQAEKAQAAIDSALTKPPGLILLSVHMQDMDGFESCRRLKQDERTQDVPIIFISAKDDIEARRQGFQAGGIDVITKPFQEVEILARVRTHLRFHRMQQRLEELVDARPSELNESSASLEQKVRELQESEERYELAIAGSAAGIWDWDLRTDKVYYSDRLKKLLGYTPDGLSDTLEEFWSRLHPDDVEDTRQTLERHLEEREPFVVDYRLRTKSGEYRWFHARGQALWDDSGEAIRMSGSITDITDRKKTEKKLVSSEERFRNLMAQSPLDIVILKPEGHISEVNKAWLRNWDVQADEADKIIAAYNIRTDRQFADLGHAPLVEKAFAGEDVVLPPTHYIPGREFKETELEGIEARERWIQTHLYPIKNEDGVIAHVVAINTDITELKQAEEDVLRSEERFRSLIEQSPMPIEILSLDGKILQSNASWNKLWGVDTAGAEEVLEKYNMRTDPQLKKLGIDHLVEKAFSGEHIILPPIIYDAYETVEDFEIEKFQGLKSPWIQCHLYPIKDKNGKVVNIINNYVDISDQKHTEAELRTAYEEIKHLKDQLEAESAYMQYEIKLEHNFENIIGQSEALKYVLHRVEQVAPTDSPVLIMGETGTGKELMARALHKLSQHGKRALVKVNCAALPGELIESELFGREKGAYTGATTTQTGRFELAKGSTLFLDEIGELPLELQAKLLRVLESGEHERLGSSRTLRSDARIIAATNRVLEEEVRKGRFREDLWYRLKVFPITVPPLRERPEDVPLLANWFADQFSRKMGKQVSRIPKRTMDRLQSYPWPGNVRELQHALESAVITATGKKLIFELPQIEDPNLSGFKTFEEMERDYILRVLKARNWKIGGKNSAASTLGMHVNTLRGRMKKLGIEKPKIK